MALTGSAAPPGSSTTLNSATAADPQISVTPAAVATPVPDIPGVLASGHDGKSTGQEPPAPQNAVKSEAPEASAIVQAPLAGGPHSLTLQPCVQLADGEDACSSTIT